MIIHGKTMVAPCGINCTYCYVHHKKKKPCNGCRQSDESKPSSCLSCKIKECVGSKKVEFCYECNDFPCVLIKRLDKSYQKRYEESLIKNLETIENQGIDEFLYLEKIRLKCPSCEGYLNIHDKMCSHCGTKYKV
ncbi:DUF3795 domain-containing protein [Fusibacter bizertensis]